MEELLPLAGSWDGTCAWFTLEVVRQPWEQHARGGGTLRRKRCHHARKREGDSRAGV